MEHLRLLARLAQSAETRIVLLILDGVGDVRTAAQPRTALDLAVTPNLDALAARSALGRLVPVAPGITPGSGPGHLALFGYDPAEAAFEIGRGVLEALGLGLALGPGDLAARGNFATADAAGNLVDRRAGRIPTEECRRLVARLEEASRDFGELSVELAAGEQHRFVLVLRGEGLSTALADTDPQRLGVPPLAARATAPEGEATAARLGPLVALLERAIRDEPRANRILLRGFSRLPHLPQFADLYRLRSGAFAGYPLYRGVAAACGMAVADCGKRPAHLVAAARERWDDFDFFFLHVKQTDAAGEDGNLAAKVQIIEEVDAALPALLALAPDVLAITGDHSTPAPVRGHSWHPVPLLVAAEHAFVDGAPRFTEETASGGHLGTFPSRYLMGLLLAHAGRLAKFGA
jgi:2,3-bisphosphoglycerate-independent phosphoglycerate mutase